MKKTKEQKGITLIALIITIVVLMILAAVAISSIQNDGILGKAQDVASKYNQAQTEEQKILDYYQLVLEQKAWAQSGTIVSRGTDTFKVGESVKLKIGTADPVAYSDSIASGATGDYTGNWVILGVEYGKLLLVSASNVVASVPMYGIKGGAANGTEYVGGYYKGVEVLNTVCSAYLNTAYADSARSITVEDINRVTGYVPAAGTTYTYTSNFIHPDGREIGKNGVTSIQETNTSYSYQGKTYITDTTDPAYVALFNNTSYGSGAYWLASTYVSAYARWAYFGLREVRDSNVRGYDLWYSGGVANSASGYGARAVVSLKSDVQVVKAS